MPTPPRTHLARLRAAVRRWYAAEQSPATARRMPTPRHEALAIGLGLDPVPDRPRHRR